MSGSSLFCLVESTRAFDADGASVPPDEPASPEHSHDRMQDDGHDGPGNRDEHNERDGDGVGLFLASLHLKVHSLSNMCGPSFVFGGFLAQNCLGTRFNPLF